MVHFIVGNYDHLIKAGDYATTKSLSVLNLPYIMYGILKKLRSPKP